VMMGWYLSAFENRRAAYFWVREHRKRRRAPHACRHHVDSGVP
jgi:hypothetical protein